jgi:hypothetical protein
MKEDQSSIARQNGFFPCFFAFFLSYCTVFPPIIISMRLPRRICQSLFITEKKLRLQKKRRTFVLRSVNS